MLSKLLQQKTDSMHIQIQDPQEAAGATPRQARYDYNFTNLGVLGLSFMTRYVRGDNISLALGVRQETLR